VILHLEASVYPNDAMAQLRAIGEVVTAEPRSVDELITTISGRPFHTLIVTLGIKISAEVMDASPTLRWIVSPTTGLDHIDLDAAAQRGITVVSLRDVPDQIRTISSTAELTWGLILAVARNIPAADQSVRSGEWDRTKFLGVQLSGRTIGIVGFGRLGRMVAKYAQAFEMEVLAHDPFISSREVDALGVSMVSADHLLSSADFITLHMTLNETSEGWMSAERLARMRRGAFLINTSRGQLIDEQAVADALLDGRLAGVGVDVLGGDSSWEGRIQTTPISEALAFGCNVVITPHIGGYSDQAVWTTRKLVTNEYRRQHGCLANDLCL
jgi:D-3-phosphoglycerate dehydrogenase / 2-oxoglutarate reductase